MDARLASDLTFAFRVDCVTRGANGRCEVGRNLFESSDAVTTKDEAAQVLWRDGWRWLNGPLCPTCAEEQHID